MRAATSRSERALWIVARLRGRRLRRRVVCDFAKVMIDAELELELEEDNDEVDIQALAQREMACSTPAEIAPNRPPKTEPPELEDEDGLDDADDREGDLGGSGGGPR